MMDTINEWWYEIDGVENGPVPTESIINLIEADMLHDESLLWTKTWPNWKPLNKTEFKKARIAPPPLKVKKKGTVWKSVIFLLLLFSTVWALRRDKSTDTSAVRQSYWDNSVDVAETYLKKYLLKDPKSYESVEWGKVQKREDGTYQVMHTFRARNGFGGMNVRTLTFIISKDGGKVIDVF